jgi:hypothetical protein
MSDAKVGRLLIESGPLFVEAANISGTKVFGRGNFEK